MQTLFKGAAGILLLIVLMTLLGAFYTVRETEMVIITQFGRPVGEPIREAGLHFKVPFIQTVISIDKRVLQWDGQTVEMPTKDKLYISVDNFARWRIIDPLLFFTSLRDERSALSRLDDIIGSETRNTVARHELVELIRTTRGRQPMRDESLTEAHGFAPVVLPDVQLGRLALENEITKESQAKLHAFGLELLDVRFKRINYNAGVAAKIYDRMVSERRQIAERFRSEGAGEAAKILGKRERDIREIESEAYRQTQVVQGEADAKATAIYAQAFNTNPEAREFYTFTRTLESYKTSLAKDTTVVFTSGEGFLQYLNGQALMPKASAAATLPKPVAKAPEPAPAAPAAPAPAAVAPAAQ